MPAAAPLSTASDTYGWPREEFALARVRLSSKQLGRNSKFGFKNPFHFFNLLPTSSALPTILLFFIGFL
jgi:hypothetical protein